MRRRRRLYVVVCELVKHASCRWRQERVQMHAYAAEVNLKQSRSNIQAATAHRYDMLHLYWKARPTIRNAPPKLVRHSCDNAFSDAVVHDRCDRRRGKRSDVKVASQLLLKLKCAVGNNVSLTHSPARKPLNRPTVHLTELNDFYAGPRHVRADAISLLQAKKQESARNPQINSDYRG